jgi:hypothetical protein
MIKFCKENVKISIPVGQMVTISFEALKLIICPQAVRDFFLQRGKYVNLYHQEEGWDIGIKLTSDREDPEAYKLMEYKPIPGALAIMCPELLHSDNHILLDCRGVWFHASRDPSNQMILVHID